MSSKEQPSFKQKVRELLWGFFFLDFYKEVVKTKANYEDALNLIILGEMLGIPLMNSTIALKLKEKEIIESVPPTI
jgi:hypothetical protein